MRWPVSSCTFTLSAATESINSLTAFCSFSRRVSPLRSSLVFIELDTSNTRTISMGLDALVEVTSSVTYASNLRVLPSADIDLLILTWPVSSVAETLGTCSSALGTAPVWSSPAANALTGSSVSTMHKVKSADKIRFFISPFPPYCLNWSPHNRRGRAEYITRHSPPYPRPSRR